MAVISESNSSRFSFSFLTNDSMARLANPSLSPPWRWHINEWTMLRQASADVGAFEGGGGGICTISRTNKRIYNRSGKINPNVRGVIFKSRTYCPVVLHRDTCDLVALPYQDLHFVQPQHHFPADPPCRRSPGVQDLPHGDPLCRRLQNRRRHNIRNSMMATKW